MINVGERVKKCLFEKGWTQKKLCSEIDISENGFKRMAENHTWKLDTIEKISSVLGVPVTYFVTEDGVDSAAPIKTESTPGFGDRVLNKMSEDLESLKLFFEEEIKVKNQQIAGLQRTVDVLVGKSEGAIVEPLSMDEFNSVFQAYMAAGLSSVKTRRVLAVNQSTAKLVAPR